MNDELHVLADDWVAKFDVTTWGWVHFVLTAHGATSPPYLLFGVSDRSSG